MIDIFNSYGYFIPTKALLVSALAIVAVVICRKAAASQLHVLAVAGLFSLLLLPLYGLFGPATSVNLPQSVSPRLGLMANQRVAAFDMTDYITPDAHWIPQVLPEPPLGPRIEYLVWCLGAFVLLGRISVGFISIWRWSMRGEIFNSSDVIRSRKAKVPMTGWAGRPVIFLPWDADTWDPERLARILAHERAHIQRKDWVWNVLGQAICAFYWPLPTVWLLQKSAKRAAEQACDDRVLSAGNAPSDYAQDLLHAAKDVRMVPATALPLITKAELVSRIQHILNPKAKRGPAGRRVLAVCIVCALIVCIPLAGARFRIEQFEPDPQYMKAHPNLLWAPPHSMHKQAAYVPTSPYGVIQFPPEFSPTVPATKGSGWIGTLSDGRQVEVVQIQHFTGAGFQVWDAGGNPLVGTPIYGPKPCNGKRGMLGIVYNLINAPATPKSLRCAINYYPVDYIRTHPEIGYYPEDRPGTSLTVVRPTSDGQLSVNNALVSEVDFNSGELPAKTQVWLNANGFLDGGSALAFRVPENTFLTSAVAFDRQNVAHPYLDVHLDPTYPLYVKLYFNIPGPEIDHINVNTEPAYVQVTIKDINFDSILGQVKEEGQ